MKLSHQLRADDLCLELLGGQYKRRTQQRLVHQVTNFATKKLGNVGGNHLGEFQMKCKQP